MLATDAPLFYILLYPTPTPSPPFLLYVLFFFSPTYFLSNTLITAFLFPLHVFNNPVQSLVKWGWGGGGLYDQQRDSRCGFVCTVSGFNTGDFSDITRVLVVCVTI